MKNFISPLGLLLFFITPAFGVITAFCPWEEPQDIIWNDKSDYTTEIRSLTVEEMKEDLACLELIFDHQYMGSDYYADRGISLTDNIATLAKTIQEKDLKLNQLEFMNYLKESHKGAVDGHMAYFLKTSKQTKKVRVFHKELYILDTKKQSGEIKSCESMQRVRGHAGKVLWVGHFVHETQTTLCHLKSGVTAKLRLRKWSDDVVLSKVAKVEKHKDWTYIRVPEFPNGTYEGENVLPSFSHDYEEVLDYLKEDSRDIPLVIDLRNNPGGSKDFIMALAIFLYSKDVVIDYPPVLAKMSLFSMGAGVNNDLLWGLGDLVYSNDVHLDSDTNPLIQYEKSKEDFFIKSETFPFMMSLSIPYSYPTMRGLRNKSFKSKIAILTNKNCHSSCEITVDLLSGLSVVKTFGTHTGGSFKFGHVGYLSLPHSKIIVKSGAMEVTLKNKKEAKEGIGILPDFYSFDEDPLVMAQRWFQESENGE